MQGTLEERFWAKVEKRGPDECWEWTASVNTCGYGALGSGKRDGLLVLAHRLAWKLASGPVPAGLCVCHTCDNRRCVNPTHLFLGTPADNMADMTAKGREARGESQGLAKLTNVDVRDIRTSFKNGIKQSVLARRFEVSRSTIHMVVRRKTWARI